MFIPSAVICSHEVPLPHLHFSSEIGPATCTLLPALVRYQAGAATCIEGAILVRQGVPYNAL